ncbi:hypothetical protein SLA2020_199220 [Shorea laevis]
MKSQKQNSINVQDGSIGLSSPILSKKQDWGEGFGPVCQDRLDKGCDWATNMGLEDGNWLHKSEVEKEVEDRSLEKVRELRNRKGGLVRTETSNVGNSLEKVRELRSRKGDLFQTKTSNVENYLVST